MRGPGIKVTPKGVATKMTGQEETKIGIEDRDNDVLTIYTVKAEEEDIIQNLIECMAGESSIDDIDAVIDLLSKYGMMKKTNDSTVNIININ